MAASDLPGAAMPVPSSITDLSTTAASNGPAGTDPISNTLDDYLRAIQAIIRQESLAKSWEAPGHTATWLSGTQFTIPTDLTSTYRVGRRLRATLAGPTYAYSTITASAFAAGVTTITVVNDSSALTSPISAIEVGPDSISMIEAGSLVASRAWATAYIAALTASETQAGILELLTDAEFIVGTDASRAMTVSNFVKSKAASGYIKLPGGITLQWGTNSDAVNNVTHTITFPVAFPTACVFVAARYDRRAGQLGSDNGALAMGYDHVSAMTTTNFQTPYTCPKIWFAVGY